MVQGPLLTIVSLGGGRFYVFLSLSFFLAFNYKEEMLPINYLEVQPTEERKDKHRSLSLINFQHNELLF